MQKAVDLFYEYEDLPETTKSRKQVQDLFRKMIIESLSPKRDCVSAKPAKDMLRRTTVLEYVKKHCGCTARCISSALGYNANRIQFHLGQLSKGDEIWADKTSMPYKYYVLSK